ncbi:MAG TPA: sugar nucleotide-binding protein [Candidatus Limnocylindria bacterium]|jgi:UDP-glucose 4,6-dehydratase|nr:sugar nucleotide-binding protein [Candidatus Limnocylindria bacterium]
MIVLLGATGYVGAAFARELKKRQLSFVAVSRSSVDYSRFERLVAFLRDTKPEFVVNAAGYTGKPNVDACEVAKADTLNGNALLPAVISHACSITDTPWGHVSSGCIYTGGKICGSDGVCRVEKDLTLPGLRHLVDTHPETVHGFAETDEPNFSFRRPPCSFYSGTKALGEEAIHGVGQNYIWRLRIPFDNVDSSRNYLSKLQRYSRVYDNVNSVSHLEDYVRACVDLWAARAPFGIYNVTNPGFVTARQVVEHLKSVLKLERDFSFWDNDEEFYRVAAQTPRSNCVMDTTKLLSTGVKMRPVWEAIDDSLRTWKSEDKT